LFLVLAETIGLWFVNFKLNISVNRVYAANIVFQLSLFTFLLGIVQSPYNALIIARQKMNIFAYMSVLEVLLKLVIVLVLPIIEYDHLIVYAALYLLVSFIIRIAYKVYCTRTFIESRYAFYYDKYLYETLLSFSGWTLFGSVSLVAKNQGVNVLLNLFFGTILNAAYGITMQVQSAVSVFLINLQVAFRPQIIIHYANKDFKKFNNLIFKASKFSFFLMLVIITPIVLNIDFILKFWLNQSPKYVSIFVTLSLISLLIDSISEPLVIGNQATGNIKVFQIFEGSFLILNLPISYFLLKQNQIPLNVFYVSIFINSMALLIRLFLVKKIIDVSSFFKIVLSRIFVVSFLVFLVAYLIRLNFGSALVFFDFIIQSAVLSILTICFLYVIGMEKIERVFLLDFLKKKLKKIK